MKSKKLGIVEASGSKPFGDVWIGPTSFYIKSQGLIFPLRDCNLTKNIGFKHITLEADALKFLQLL